MKRSKGITLIALVITIIILLILSGVVLSLGLGENGIIRMAITSKDKYKNQEEKEKQDLDKLYSSIQVAGDSKVTLTMEELDEYINSKMQQPTGIKTDAYIKNTRTVTTAYNEVTSMTGLTKTADENNNMAKYLEYSNEDGYTVLKSGWYFIDINVKIMSNSPADLRMNFYINNIWLTSAYAWASNGMCSHDANSFSIYLNQGDKIYFSSYGNNVATQRIPNGYVYPML